MKYVANVEVEAKKIVAHGLILNLEDGSQVQATPHDTARYLPDAGDYVVTSSDGFVTVLPKKVVRPSDNPRGIPVLSDHSEDSVLLPWRLRTLLATEGVFLTLEVW